MFQVVVLKKNLEAGILEVMIRKFICYAFRKEDTKRTLENEIQTLESKSMARKYLNNIHEYCIKGFIHFSEIVYFAFFSPSLPPSLPPSLLTSFSLPRYLPSSLPHFLSSPLLSFVPSFLDLLSLLFLHLNRKKTFLFSVII